MGNYNLLHQIMSDMEEKEARILIIDNNNLEFCSQHELLFPPSIIFNNYDLILVPEWVHAEISHSEKRLEYLADIPTKTLILNEEEDYIPLINNQEFKLMQLFGHASNSITKARKVIGELKKYYNQNLDLPEDWIIQFCENAFQINISTRIVEGENKVIELKKNAGETSILVLAYLLIHRFSHKIKHITVFSSDKGSLTIKKCIMDNLGKMELIHNSFVPISFKSTDVLLIEAIKDGRIQLEDIRRLRTNSKTVIYTQILKDSSSHRGEHVMDTNEFIRALETIDEYHFEF